MFQSIKSTRSSSSSDSLGRLVAWAVSGVVAAAGPGCSCGGPGNSAGSEAGDGTEQSVDVGDVADRDAADVLDGGDGAGVDAVDAPDGGDAAEGADVPSDGSTPPIALAELGTYFVADLCTKYIDCYGFDYCSLAHCEADQAPFELSTLDAEIAMGWVSYDPVAAAACHDRFVSDPCGFPLVFLPRVEDVLAACGNVLTGHRTAGQSCVTTAECVTDTACWHDTSCLGTCMAFIPEGGSCGGTIAGFCDYRVSQSCRNGACSPPWNLGDACSRTFDCWPQYWCDIAMGHCVRLATMGEMCQRAGSSAPPCATGLWCDSFSGVGMCQPPSGAGGSCLEDADCISGLTCLPTTGFPAPGTCGALSPAGGPCDSTVDCTTDLRCDTTARMCVPLPGLGEPCNTVFGEPACATGFACDGTNCGYRRCPGDACTAPQSVCWQGFCTAGTCTTRAPLGNSCVLNDDCASRDCRASVCSDPYACSI